MSKGKHLLLILLTINTLFNIETDTVYSETWRFIEMMLQNIGTFSTTSAKYLNLLHSRKATALHYPAAQPHPLRLPVGEVKAKSIV